MTDTATKAPNETQATNASSKPKKLRSPSYPGLNLQDSIEKARVIHAQGRQDNLPIEVVAKLWGFKNATNGAFNITLAALKKFGLLEEVGGRGMAKRQLKVTDGAVEILYGPASPKYAECLRAAAMRPAIHREIWDKWKMQLPGNDVMQYYFVRERKFGEDAYRWVVREYQESMRFAGFTNATDYTPSGTVKEGENEGENDGEELKDLPEIEENASEKNFMQPPAQPATPPPPKVSGLKHLAVTLDNGSVIPIQYPMSGSDYKLLLGTLDLWKERLTDGEIKADKEN